MASKLGFGILVAVVLGTMLAIAVTESVMIKGKKKPLGYYVNEFMVQHPWFAGMLGFVFGAMIAHFFLHIVDG